MTDPVAYPKLHVSAGEDFLLLSPTAQAHAYRNVDRMFATRPIRRGGAVLQLERGQEMSPRYQTGEAYKALTRTWIVPTSLGFLSSSTSG